MGNNYCVNLPESFPTASQMGFGWKFAVSESQFKWSVQTSSEAGVGGSGVVLPFLALTW